METTHSEPAQRFLRYLCTHSLRKFNRPKNPNDDSADWVTIPERPNGQERTRYIDGDLIPYNGKPGEWREIIKQLIEEQRVERMAFDVPGTKRKGYKYKPGANTNPVEYFDPEMINVTPPKNELHREICRNLSYFYLPGKIQQKKYLDYLKQKNEARLLKYATAFIFLNSNPELFFKVDDFAGRIHTPFSSMERDFRPFIEAGGEPTASIDLKTSQPLILGEILNFFLPGNEFTQWTRSGKDVYQLLSDRAGLDSRNKGKQLFFELIFAPPKKELNRMFPGADWVKWLNETKGKGYKHPRNKMYEVKKYNVIAFYLQTTEAMLMTQVWKALHAEKIPFLTIHDEVVIRVSDADQAEKIFRAQLDKGLKTGKGNKMYFKHAKIHKNKYG